VDKIPEKLISKFIAGKRLTNDEFILLDKLLNNLQFKEEVNHWLEENWQHREPKEVKLQFKQIREKIRLSSLQAKMNRLFIVLGKAAAVLFIPLLAAVLYFYFNHTTSSDLLTLTTQKGKQTSLILPDGSKVWLNVDTKLSYPLDYGVKSRNLKLEGEAYFEVEKNDELPFEVASANIITRALGTRFVVSAYPESSVVKTSLVEGSVEINYNGKKDLLKSGQQFVFDKKKSEISFKAFDENYELAWKNNQLVFRLTPFADVIIELEKWFDVNIEYDPAVFKYETLTVQFEKYESLETILRVIAKANGFKFTIKDNNVKIIK
jgi:ferric-dicitrate binding protein FerR (iron transport regulator)